MTEEKELQPVDIEWEAEKICRWGASPCRCDCSCAFGGNNGFDG